MAKISISINEATLACIDRVAERLGEGRSLAIRHIVREFKQHDRYREGGK